MRNVTSKSAAKSRALKAKYDAAMAEKRADDARRLAAEKAASQPATDQAGSEG